MREKRDGQLSWSVRIDLDRDVRDTIIARATEESKTVASFIGGILKSECDKVTQVST